MTARPGNWVLYSLVTVALWGVWGALAGLSAQHGFPDTLVYCVWSLTMIPPALYISQQYLTTVLPDRKFFRFQPLDDIGVAQREILEADCAFLLPHQAAEFGFGIGAARRD